MRLEIERSGGFAGLTKKVTVDTEDLPGEIAKNIKKFLEDNISFKSSSPLLSKKKAVADSYVYKIIGKSPEKKQEIEFDESNINYELKRCINYVLKNY